MSKTKERCGNCKYCFPIKWLRDGKWHYSACCIVFPATEPNDKNSFALIVDMESDHCEMYSARGASIINQKQRLDDVTNEESAPRLVSLFSGCGGMDKGFESAGFNRVWANDFDTDAQAVFKLNFGDIDGRDITTVPVEDIPDCDIITAGFPCQPFSNAGNRRGVYDERGELYLECLRIIESKNPKAVLFENVKGLLSSKHQSGKKLIEVIKEDLENIGYNVNYKVVNASDYGVPQNRERMILVALRNDLGKEFQFPSVQKDKSRLTLRNILTIPDDVPNQKYWPYSPQAQQMIEQIPQGGSWKNIPYENLSPRFKRIRDDMKRYHAPNFYRRFSLDEINGTITASAQPENCGITHPTENRRYTIREIARIQTFPDDFLFIDETTRDIVAMYKVIGNAVPVRLAEVIAKAIMQQAFTKEENDV